MVQKLLELRATEGGIRLDRFLAANLVDYSRSALQRLIDGGLAQVNGSPAKAGYRLRTGDQVALQIPETEPAPVIPESISLAVVYEDDHILVVDKPAGMVVHPAPGHHTGTLVNALLAYCPRLADAGGDRPGIVHRLDRDTSGLIVVAKTDPIRRALQRQFQERRVHKTYLALLDGRVDPTWGRICAPLDRDPHHRQRIAVVVKGRDATTEYRVLEYLSPSTELLPGGFTLAQVEPETGRTHQIRVHFASIGHPVSGDTVYGRRRCPLPLVRHFLHAWRLDFEHPSTAEHIELQAPLPPDLARVLDFLRASPG
ncbi:MAG TPA: RluA family pseudouridine synthase [Anaerolineae bacterium]|nr:RluA family pseudouridine synthase [Anaerolineae bacterium]